MTGNWARTEHVRGKGSAANCMLCGRKPHILEKGFYDGSHSFTVCCPHCWNKRFKDKRETGVSITVVAEDVYSAIRDWNKINTRVLCWRPKPLPRATHCIVAIKWAEDDIEVTEADTTFLLKENSERIVAWMPLPDPPKGGNS